MPRAASVPGCPGRRRSPSDRRRAAASRRERGSTSASGVDAQPDTTPSPLAAARARERRRRAAAARRRRGRHVARLVVIANPYAPPSNRAAPIAPPPRSAVHDRGSRRLGGRSRRVAANPIETARTMAARTPAMIASRFEAVCAARTPPRPRGGPDGRPGDVARGEIGVTSHHAPSSSAHGTKASAAANATVARERRRRPDRCGGSMFWRTASAQRRRSRLRSSRRARAARRRRRRPPVDRDAGGAREVGDRGPHRRRTSSRAARAARGPSRAGDGDGDRHRGHPAPPWDRPASGFPLRATTRSPVSTTATRASTCIATAAERRRRTRPMPNGDPSPPRHRLRGRRGHEEHGQRVGPRHRTVGDRQHVGGEGEAGRRRSEGPPPPQRDHATTAALAVKAPSESTRRPVSRPSTGEARCARR